MRVTQPVNPARVYGRGVVERSGGVRLEPLGAAPIAGHAATRGAYVGSGAVPARAGVNRA